MIGLQFPASPAVHASMAMPAPTFRKSNRKALLLMGHTCIVLLAALLTFTVGALFQPGQAATWSYSVILTGLFVWCVVSWRLSSGTIFNPYGLFLLSTLAFNAGQVPLEVLALNDH